MRGKARRKIIRIRGEKIENNQVKRDRRERRKREKKTKGNSSKKLN